MRVQLIRHATLWLEYAGMRLLVDPMFAEKGANPPIPGTPNMFRRNPLVSLPDQPNTWSSPDGILVTHLHPDHWDRAAAGVLSSDIPLWCQPGDGARLTEDGFTRVTEVSTPAAAVEHITITLTGGRHGTGEIGRRMGRVSGFILQAPGEPTVYIAGDTIWCEEVREALVAHKPDVIILNAGGARFLLGDPITMTGDDILHVCEHAPSAHIIAVHMDAINHCVVTRAKLRAWLTEDKRKSRVAIPEDGEWMEYG